MIDPALLKKWEARDAYMKAVAEEEYLKAIVSQPIPEPIPEPIPVWVIVAIVVLFILLFPLYVGVMLPLWLMGWRR